MADRKAALIEWIQIGEVTIEPDGSASGPMGFWISARDVRVLLGPGPFPQRKTFAELSRPTDHDPGDEDRR
jgi:hypothetical protein